MPNLPHLSTPTMAAMPDFLSATMNLAKFSAVLTLSLPFGSLLRSISLCFPSALFAATEHFLKTGDRSTVLTGSRHRSA